MSVVMTSECQYGLSSKIIRYSGRGNRRFVIWLGECNGWNNVGANLSAHRPSYQLDRLSGYGENLDHFSWIIYHTNNTGIEFKKNANSHIFSAKSSIEPIR